MKKHNFNAGPAILPQSVMSEAALAVTDFNNSGLSLLEISHRDKAFIAVMDEAQQLVVELLGLDDSYAVLFLSGGASSQFFMVPMNLLSHDQSAAYVDSGSWASKAIKEAKAFGNVNVLGSSKKDNYSYIPKDYIVDAKEQYLHLTSNNPVAPTDARKERLRSLVILTGTEAFIFVIVILSGNTIPIRYYPLDCAKSLITEMSTSTLSKGSALYIDARKPPTDLCPFKPTMPASLHASRKGFSSFGLTGKKLAFIRERSALTETAPLNNGLASSSL